MADIQILGKLKSATADKIIADAEEIADGDSTVGKQLRGLDYVKARLGVTATDAVSITATFAQGNEWVYAGDELDTLRQYLTVTATLPDETTVAVTDYALTGTLTEGVSTITALYGALSASFTVKVTGALPEGYTRFDYIEAIRQSSPAESQRILTKKYDNLHDLSLNLLFGHTFGTSIGEATDKTGGFVLGGRASSDWTKEAFNVNVFTDGVKMTTHGRESDKCSASLPANTQHRLVYTNTAASPSSFRVDGGTAQTIAWNTTNAANVALAVGSRQKEGEAALLSGGVQCGEFELTALDGTVVGHYIPCIKKDGSNFIIGLYETVDKLFYTASDTTRATVDNTNCLYFTGNWPKGGETTSNVDYTEVVKREVYAAVPNGNAQAFTIYADGETGGETIFLGRNAGDPEGRLTLIDGKHSYLIKDFSAPYGHFNSLSLGARKINVTDEFPTLLAEGDNENAYPADTLYTDAVNQHKFIRELRVTRSGQECVKTYKIPARIAGFYTGLSVSEDGKVGYSIGTTLYSIYNESNQTITCRWDMENLTENEDGTFTPALLASVIGPRIYVIQGQQYHDGYLWVPSGVANVEAKIYAVNVDTGAIEYTINTGVIKELEAVAWLNDTEMVVGYAGGIFEKFTFRKAE